MSVRTRSQNNQPNVQIRSKTDLKTDSELSDESLIAFSENKHSGRIKWKDMSDEEKRRWKREHLRIWRSNLSEERKEEMAMNRRHYYANLTEEQKKKRAEYNRKAYNNLNEAQRQRRSAYYANMTPEQRFKKLIRERERRANLTPEQRLARKQKNRERVEKLSEEERQLKLAERRERRRARATDEFRMRRAEQERERRANLTAEQHQELLKRSRERARKYQMTEEQRIRKSISGRERRQRLLEIKQQTEDPFNLCSFGIVVQKNSNSFIINNVHRVNFKRSMIHNHDDNPLLELINNVPMKISMMKEKINLDRNLLERVLQVLELNFPRDVECLIETIRIWKGWRTMKRTELKFIRGLYSYLRINLCKMRDVILTELSLFAVNCESTVIVSCSMKQLQNLFHKEPHKHANYFRSKLPIDYVSPTSLPHYIFNWPYISTQITLPGFSMIHQNVNHKEYYVVNHINRLQNYEPEKVNLSYKSPLHPNKMLAVELINFLHQLRLMANEKNEDEISAEKKTDLNSILSELQYDVATIPDYIHSNTEYYINLNPYPYNRYLDFPNDSEAPAVQKRYNNEILLNVRLHEICFPRAMFTVEEFDIPCIEIDNKSCFMFSTEFLEKIDTCVIYKCILCNEDLGFASVSEELNEHFLKYHGFEPDWQCTYCNKTFTTYFLSKNRWNHQCF